MLFRSALAGTVVAKIVDIHTVYNVRDAPLPGDFIETREQFILAVEAAVGTIGCVLGIIELAGGYVFVTDAVLAGERLSVEFVRLGKRGRVRGNGHGVITKHAM